MASPVVSKKRKRSQEPEIPAINDEVARSTESTDAGATVEQETPKILTPQEVASIQKKIFHTIKEAGRAFKKARDFEVRKIIKRIKAAKDAEETSKIERLEKELRLAKSLDVHPYAHSYVYKKLQTDELFIENPNLLEEHAPPGMEASMNEATVKNIVGRLASTAVVKTTMTMLLNAIHRAAGIEFPHEQAAPKKPKGPKNPAKANSPTAQSSKSQKLTLERSESPDDGRTMNPHELLKLIENEKQHPGNGSQQSEEEHPSPHFPPNQTKKPTRLPALSTGYILPSDSDSDPDQEYASFAPLKKERKNRRGQRERQAIWLKKYGSAARHLHPELKQQNVTSKKKPRKIQGGLGGDVKTTAEAFVEAAPPAKVNDPHPSWVAKQKMREQQQAVMHSAKAKKIVFD